MISVLIIAFASNLDNLAIGIAFGIRSTKIPILSNLIVALITMLGTYLSMTMGEVIAHYISGFMSNLIGAALLLGIGLWSIIKSLPCAKQNASSNNDDIKPIPNPYACDANKDNVISLKESFTLGIALAMNNIATGIGAGTTGVSPLWTTIMAGVFSLIFIGCGSKFGYTIASTWFGKFSGLVAGILLILIGIYEMIV
nr:sporulation membrane protein YtaF [Scopulibacillus daqui]